MKKLLGLPLLVFIAGFALGVIAFFPVEQLQVPLQNAIAGAIRGDLQMGRVSVGTGLGLGLNRGGLIALHADSVVLTLRSGQSFECEHATISPRLLPLLLLRASIAFRCELPKESQITGLLAASPIWNPTTANVELELNKIPLDMADGFMPGASFAGIVNGEVTVNDLDLQVPPGLAQISWDVRGEKITLPPVMNDLVKLPSISLGPIDSTGNYSRGKLQVQKLNFGNEQLPLQGQLKMDFGLDPTGMPISGELSGMLRTDPAFEASQLKNAINLNLLFGKVKENGRREFKKPIRGNLLMSLMAPPVE